MQIEYLLLLNKSVYPAKAMFKCLRSEKSWMMMGYSFLVKGK